MARREEPEGLIPWIWRYLVECITWVVTHPQPILIVFVVSGVLWGLWTQARYAEAFHVTRVETPASINFELSQPVVGTNIWEVDLAGMAKNLRQQQPWLRDVRVVRALPDTIRIEAIHRIPVAQVRIQGWHPVDGEGYILPREVETDETGLVRLEGFMRRSTALSVGELNENPELLRALRVLTVLRQTPMLQDYRLSHLNIEDKNQIRFNLDDQLEVRCGSEGELPTQLERLRISLELLRRQNVDARQIDVRFPEPVVTPRA